MDLKIEEDEHGLINKAYIIKNKKKSNPIESRGIFYVRKDNLVSTDEIPVDDESKRLFNFLATHLCDICKDFQNWFDMHASMNYFIKEKMSIFLEEKFILFKLRKYIREYIENI